MLKLDIYSYVSELYYRETLSTTYNGCAQPIGSNLDWRVEDEVMKTLPLILLSVKLEDLENKEFHLEANLIVHQDVLIASKV